MNAHVKIGHEIALQRSLPDVVEEYETKKAGLMDALRAAGKACGDLAMAATVGGTYGETNINSSLPAEWALEQHLLKSAWKHVYDGLNIERLASPVDKQRWKQSLEKPAPFTLDNIRGTFGKYITDPRGNILRALAEVFCGLDPAFKSHDKMKIGVKGLPKRVILSNVSSYSSYGRDKLQSILNALAAIQGKPLVSYRELDVLLNDENGLLKAGDLPKDRYDREVYTTPGRGVRLRRFDNGNGHLFFEPDTLKDINLALAEFYGDVLPDTPDENPTKQKSTAVSKDLQYYPTPAKVVEDVIDNLYQIEGAKILEPSCGCGRFMDALRKKRAHVYGFEVDPGRAAICRAKGHTVYHGNFLESSPTGDFDYVCMNPPFYGRHWLLHVIHAFKFLKPGGTLKAILPITARDVPDLIEQVGAAKPSRWGDGAFSDLPVGSFSESGTNINTTVLTLLAPNND
ncbi:DUF4942 domain-containing protein [Bradyrhizobium sp. PMVTL-01]|uniref:DUF4942 domain-containing protein n=1 Tax=Bradyrhizobium sp. PMVTL-01 TaxID=3434999 RepID=UPI003F730BCF